MKRRLDIARKADMRPAYEHFRGRVTATMLRDFGGDYAKAREAINQEAAR